ncbi:MAG: hypothetical protein COB67_05805 [SAR324 cluster bacterium]|uniref:Uncharacterized protein n=1 Tax=SAR324 cluster bacterium TaxID=2024889 RepID=A0A2A4T4X2_9DELT|nr:MAG: hypothetical protein COB67_05805 [SAR324 cluster bacterium]
MIDEANEQALSTESDSFLLIEKSVRKSVYEARILLSYAAQNGFTIEKELIKVVVEANHAIRDNLWTIDLETEFWIAFRTLATAIAPVSIRSLKATLSQEKNIPHAVKTSVTFLFTLVCTIILLLFGQIYSGIGFSRYDDLKKTNLEYEVLMASVEKHPTELSDVFSLTAKEFNLKRIKILHKICDRLPASLYWQIDMKLDPDTQFCTKGVEPNTTAILKNIEITLEAFNSYLLPLLYGLLGALAYVLRALTTAIKKLTYTKESLINYLLRLALGALAGLAIGWFLKPEAQSFQSVQMLSPLALAFLAGYSVELLFSALDKIVVAFTSSKELRA